jgi:hypothetical protein
MLVSNKYQGFKSLYRGHLPFDKNTICLFFFFSEFSLIFFTYELSVAPFGAFLASPQTDFSKIAGLRYGENNCRAAQFV